MSKKPKLPNPFLSAVTGAAIIAAGGIAAAQAQAPETECEPWRPDMFRNGACGFNTDKKERRDFEVPRTPTPSTQSYSS